MTAGWCGSKGSAAVNIAGGGGGPRTTPGQTCPLTRTPGAKAGGGAGGASNPATAGGGGGGR
jgi:hypothetical protein